MKGSKKTLEGKPEKHVNRTGIALSPVHAKELIEGAAHTHPSMSGDETGIATVRAAYMRDAEPIGSIPPPTNVKSAAKVFTVERMAVLLDKIGARLAFERTGTRLYQAIIGKVESGTPFEGGPTLERLTQIMREEQQHFELLREAMESMGGDPTAVTPSADVEATLSMGVPQVLHDARTDVHQSLEAILLAELADNDGWAVLIELARSLGHEDLATRFEVALEQEAQHLRDVRGWVKASTLAVSKTARAGAPATR
ncbi:ferritin-like domain-containing protein [Sandaracinus amylolyticus]|uniref:ferritin-like domain-containing protein n=1 Tax=Sandaracinus amylolyticus TaxID=927083 RepID=UPI001F263FCF|nr:ferritin-like domain-containing protein [Sandaracinus amylolyticus]UJR83620.1 Hypothetical protein I5071_56880 [Sandaracinus amylolyticus]